MNHRQILFLDIETVPEFEKFKDMPEHGREAFMKRFSVKIQEKLDAPTSTKQAILELSDLNKYDKAIQEVYQENASFMAEYSRIVAISMAYIYQKDNSKDTNQDYLRVNTLMGTSDPGSERTLLEDFCKIITATSKIDVNRMLFDFLCAHNGKLFDFPFIVKRLIIHKMPIPRLLNNFYKKPWEAPLIDTNELWNTTNKKTYISLDAIAYCLGVPSPKSDMNGSMVEVAFRAGEYERIKKYCSLDTITLAVVYLVMIGRERITEEFIEIK